MASQKFKHKRITFTSNTVERNISKFKDKGEDEVEARPCFIAHLQPEILPMELMKTLLITRGGGEDIKNEESLERIIDLFYKYITPKPQRTYKMNRKGKELIQNQKMRGDLHTESGQSYKIIESNPEKASKLGLHKTDLSSKSADESRLKRPVLSIDPERKKIKLSSSSSSSTSFDKIKITDKSSRLASSEGNKKEEKRDRNEVKCASQSTSSSGNKKIKLDRNHSSSDSKSNSDLEDAKQKKKKPISWP